MRASEMTGWVLTWEVEKYSIRMLVRNILLDMDTSSPYNTRLEVKLLVYRKSYSIFKKYSLQVRKYSDLLG